MIVINNDDREDDAETLIGFMSSYNDSEMDSSRNNLASLK